MNWNKTKQQINNLPYGRNSSRNDLSLVLSEQRGTCSSKHAYLKQFALDNNIEGVKLILGMYKMNHKNTPTIGNVLIEHKLEFIPEAHCYLLENGIRNDYTFRGNNKFKLEQDLLQEIEIEPQQVADYKIQYHQQFIREWKEKNSIPFSFKELWDIREQCISNIVNCNQTRLTRYITKPIIL